MARLSLSKNKMKRSKLAMVMQWWLYILHLLELFMELAYSLVERQCMHRVIGLRARYRLDFYDNRDVIEKWVYTSDRKCMNDFRMPRRPFFKLCHLLSTIGKLEPTRHMLVDEQVAIFLNVLAHHKKNRSLQNSFHRSAEAISRSFRKVLVAVIRLQGHLYKKPEPIPENSTDERWKCFKGCLGALDGTHIPVQVPAVDRPRYRNRKGQIATNVLAACTPNLQFTYVLPGWEGSAADVITVYDMMYGESTSGFGWDPNTNMVVAESHIWNAYVKSHKDAASWRNRSFPNFEMLLTVFGKDRATGKDAVTAEDVLEEESRNEEAADTEMDHFLSSTDRDECNSKQKKRKRSDDGVDAFREAAMIIGSKIEEATNKLSQALGVDLDTAQKSDNVNDELLKLSNLSMLQRHRALLAIARDPATTRSFFTLKDYEKEDFVKALLRGDL